MVEVQYIRKCETVINPIETGKNLKRIMLQNGYSVKDIQFYLNLGTVQSIYHWLDGKSLPTIDHLYALSELFQLPIDSMICGNRRYVPRDGRVEQKTYLFTYYEKLSRLYTA